MNLYLKRFLQGLLLGFALITAIGGGTMAVLMGIYDDLIIAVSDFRKHPKKSLQLLVPTAIGGIISMAALFYPLKLALQYFPFITISFFVGLTFGGLRVFNKSLKGNFTKSNILMAIVGFVFVISLGVITWFSTHQINLDNIDILQIIIIFFVAVIAMGGFVAPGLSGTFILISFGYYETLVDFLLRIIKFEFVNVGYDITAFIVFALGSFIGLIAIAKIFNFLFRKNHVKTDFTVLGFIVGSLVIAYFNGDIKGDYANIQGFEVWNFIFCILALVGGVAISYVLFGLVSKKESQNNVTEFTE